MTSYMYNPSQKVTDILSKFFDFDPSELELGIWSGDLQLKNVKLRQETIHPLLNRKANKPHTDPLKKAPLHLKLVSGTVGNMRIQIPWKRLVWGQGAVQIDISDVMIVLALQSREETEEQRQKGLLKLRKKKKKEATDTGVSKAYRDAKQRRLREAEKRHMQGLPVGLYLETLHRKNSIQREAAKAEKSISQTKKVKQPGRLDKWLSNVGTDLFWRFFAGIQGNISKARIVVVQDGVEVGCIIQSISVVAGKDGTQVQVNLGEDSSNPTDGGLSETDSTPPENVMYESAYEDGEHVDKTIKQQGLGLFIRREVSMAKVPKALRFSTSVSADDYILRPVDLDLSFSFFYPYPPERRKKRAIDSQSNQTQTTVASSSGVSAAVSVSDSTTNASSKRRRGKRERDRVTPNITPSPVVQTPSTEDRLATMSRSGSLIRGRKRPLNRRMGLEAPNSTNRQMQRMGSRASRTGHTPSSGLSSVGPSDFMSVHESPTVIATQSSEPVPKFECQVSLKTIRIVYSTRHHELLNYFLSTVARMQNGRPDQMIRSTPKETDTALLHRKFLDGDSVLLSPMVSPTPKPADSRLSLPKAKVLRDMLAPLTGFRGASTDTDGLDSEAGTKNENIPKRRSLRSQALIKWWKYSIGAILWEVRKRKHLTANFREMYISFDWNRQRYKRKEYVELYIAKKLKKRDESVWPFEEEDTGEEDLLRIEDELPLEQILLYRSIARSIHVRGLTKMPDSIRELHTSKSLRLRRKVHKHGRKRLPSKDDDFGEQTNLLSMVRQKFEFSSELRLPGGVQKSFQTSGASGFGGPLRASAVGSNNDDSGEVLSYEAAPIPEPLERDTSGFSASFRSDSGFRTPSGRQSSRQGRKASVGFDASSDIQAGNFYTSGNRRESHADVRTIRTNQKKDAKSIRIGKAGSAGATVVKTDDRMRISFSMQIKCIDIMVVEEEYRFDISPDQLAAMGQNGHLSRGDLSHDYYSGGEGSSSDDVSELSVLTDDRRFFNEAGQIGVIAEEEEHDEEAARMSSTDFLLFGLPEKPLIRLTFDSMGCSVRGKSGGPLHIGLSVRRIDATSENDLSLLSIGGKEPRTPLSELNFESFQRRRSLDSLDSVSQLGDQSLDFTARGTRALALAVMLDESKRDVECEIAGICVTLDMKPVAQLLKFYSRSEIKYPDKVLEKSSGDVARKFMVYKTTGSEKSGLSSTGIRVYGLEVRVPHPLVDSSESSSLDFSNTYEDNVEVDADAKGRYLSFSVDDLDLYGGTAVDDICAAVAAHDLGASRGSHLSESLSGRRGALTKSLEMINIVELTSSNDSFSCKHWVASAGNIACAFELEDGKQLRLVDVPIDVEVLMTVNEMSLLESELPKNQIVLEVSPMHLVVSKERLALLATTKACLDLSTLDSSAQIMRRRRKPDPPRIEILARRILHSVDLNCRRVRLAIVRDTSAAEESLSVKMKEVIMEESLADFLSVVSCFDFRLPNEEALSSAMQVCIGRLVGLGLTDDEAWGCTNAARLNFLDDIALMRQTQSDVFVQMASSLRNDADLFKAPLHEEGSEDQEFDLGHQDVEAVPGSNDDGSAITQTTEDVSFDDDDSANSYDIVETTLHNAVEKTVAVYAPLLNVYTDDVRDLNLSSILTFDLPLGLSMSMIRLFYDHHFMLLFPSLIVTNSAGVELMTLVPKGEEDGSHDLNGGGKGLFFARYELEKDYGFGSGGLPMSALAADDREDLEYVFRERTRHDDIELGEVEMLFSSKIYEELVDELSTLGKQDQPSSNRRPEVQSEEKRIETSLVTLASSVSVLFTSDELVPFSRLTLEMMCYRNTKALGAIFDSDLPSWSVVSEAASLQNLTPEGQFYPEVLSEISQRQKSSFPLEVLYYKSPDPWQQSSRLSIKFNGFRLFLLRHFIYEILHFFVYDKYGLGRLKKKYSNDVRDAFGNQKPPLLYTVRVQESSIICPRCSTSSDMVAFEVEDASIAVSYIPESFHMPTKAAAFDPSPGNSSSPLHAGRTTPARTASFVSTTSEYYECADEPCETEEIPAEPISSFTKKLKKRLTISLNRVNVYTVIAKDTTTRDIVESPSFRYYHAIDGRASDRKQVYMLKPGMDQQSTSFPKLSSDCQQYWEEISMQPLTVEVFADYAPHMRLFIGSREDPVMLDARLSQLCLLLSIWDSNMQEMPSMFPFFTDQVKQSATPPTIPRDFPSYGTDELLRRLEDTSSIRSEICCIFKVVSLRCTFDPPGHFSVDPGCFQYFEDPGCSESEKTGLVLRLEDAVVHVINDFMNVRRIGVGASSLSLIDERRVSYFQEILSTKDPSSGEQKPGPQSWADVAFGLRNDIRTLDSPLNMPVQFSVFMSPGWSLINVGAQSANGTMHELSWIWLFLDYFKSYYSDVAFGNPGHQAQRWTHKVKNALRKSRGEEPVAFKPLPGMNVDFRLWLCKPVLCLPSDYHSPHAPSLIIDSRTGLWYRYKSMRNISSQEVSSTDLNLYFSSEYRKPSFHRQNDVGIAGVRALIQNLSFGLRYDSNNDCNHKDVSVRIPFMGENVPDLSVSGDELEVKPFALSSPVVCKPVKHLPRSLGPKVCEITCIIEVLPITSSTFMNFFKGPTDVNEDFVVEEEDEGPPTYTAGADIADLRIFAIDPVLGVQLPVAIASIASLQLSSTQLSPFPVETDAGEGQSSPEDLQVTMKSNIWADYFKLGMTRSWEPLLEPFEFVLMYEKSKERGQGYFFDSDTPFHVNLSGALLQVLGDTIESFSTLIKETFGEKATSEQALRRVASLSGPSKDKAGAVIEDAISLKGNHVMKVLHEIPKPLKEKDRVAFSLRNLTGQKIRVHQQMDRSTESFLDKPAIVTYLNDNETMGLTFAATISIVKNLSVVEVPYPGLPNSTSGSQHKGSLKHAIDMQVPGFRWIEGMKVDTFGRQFEPLTPRSPQVQAKLTRDWRLRNAMMVLTEVGLDSGGRLVTIRSLFEVKNNTTHPVRLVFNPDPRHKQHSSQVLVTKEYSESPTNTRTDISRSGVNVASEITTIKAGDTFQIPTLLLERSLQMSGSHLGCLWLCPDTKDQSLSFWNFFQAHAENEELEASFCSRPVQLAKLVHESSVLFQQSSGEDISVDRATSGIQVSCPMRSKKGDGRAPFCYAIEVGRSPLVNLNRERVGIDVREALPADGKMNKKKVPQEKRTKKTEERVHGPVAYSLSIHAPLVIVNLLPEGGRFELMHAIRRTVVWYADLQPGQQVPVHSVGLDAPLLLLVNLGFCRTPVGEGALVHHGADAVGNGKEQGVRLKSIGKAALKGTKQIGKTLTAMSDTPDRRVQGRLTQIQASQKYPRQVKKEKGKGQAAVLPNESLGLESEGNAMGVGAKVHSVETIAYLPSDVASETTVVDSVGQRLSLSIENIRGGGGQRRISLFCPFWIVNTTEHALRYRQEKGKSFVSGTVTSPEKDGSRPVDGSNRNYRQQHRARTEKTSSRRMIRTKGGNQDAAPLNLRTVFSGTPGALATAPGTCDLNASELSTLIEKDLSLEKLAQIAFMFNFNDEGLSIGNQMLSMQLYDGNGQLSYVSDWSKGFSLDSVGFSQIVAMHTKDGRMIELSVEVNVAPDFLSSYTKIVRLMPRYVVFNRLARPIRLWQDSSIFRPANEDRVASSDFTEPPKDHRKWRYDFEEHHDVSRMNQYELLYGRPATIVDSDVNPRHLAEGTTAHRSALYIGTYGPNEMVPFLLPDTRSERQLRIDLGRSFHVSSSFASDLPGEHTLKATPAVDLRLLNHVSTRAAPKYKIVLPPPEDSTIDEWDGELGVFFETDWGGDRRIIVKGTKRGRFAYNHTDIHVGDELLRVDGVSVLRMTFAEAMKLIKDKLAQIQAARELQKALSSENNRRAGMLRRLSVAGKRRNSGSQASMDDDSDPVQLTLTFRTLEERLRKLRLKAGRGNSTHHLSQHGHSDERESIDNFDMGEFRRIPEQTFDVELKSLHNTMFVILKEQDKNNPSFQIQNRSIHHVVFYRQRGCDGHPWNVLMPGQSLPYSWEEPMRSKKLLVRVAFKTQELFKVSNQDTASQDDSASGLASENEDREIGVSDHDQHGGRTVRLRQALAYQYVENEERGGYGPSVTVRLEEIGYRSLLPLPSTETGRVSARNRKFLNCEVDTDGGTRLLIISDDANESDDRTGLSRHLEILRKQIAYERQRMTGLHSLQYLLSKETSGVPAETDNRAERIQVIEEDSKRFVDDFEEDSTIKRCHQIVVEVLEVVGLNNSDFVAGCNPYCEIFLKGRSKSRQYFFQKRRNKRKTYFIEKSLNPRWTDQTFVFDVPEEAVKVTRGHHLQVKVRNFRLVGQHPIMGQATVHFGSLRSQKELVGWYPLAGRTGRSDLESAQSSDGSRGSIKLRVQWVYTVSALIDYFVMLSQERLNQLTRSKTGMTEQLSHAIASDERKRDSGGKINSGRIQKLAKLEKKTVQREPARRRQLAARKDGEKVRVVGKLNQGLNTSLSVMKHSLKASRDRYLYALYYQTAESKRNRHSQVGHTNQEDSVGESTVPSEQMGSGTNSNSTLQKESKRDTELRLSNHRTLATIHSPRISEVHPPNRQSLDDFFSKQNASSQSTPLVRAPNDVSESPRRTNRRLGDEAARRLRASTEDESIDKQLERWHGTLRNGQALYDGILGHSQDLTISDLISVNTDSDEGTKRKKATRELQKLGLLFHESGVFFHESHLRRHFRRSIFADSIEDKRLVPLYRARFAVGTSSSMRYFKSWQAAGALFFDPGVKVVTTQKKFLVSLRDADVNVGENQPDVLGGMEMIEAKLGIPDIAPVATKKRAASRVENIQISRTRFERAAKRSLGAVLNPGGWLTVRPITALNLPDTFTGMFVKLRYGSETLVSETVNAKVTPRWGLPVESHIAEEREERLSFRGRKPFATNRRQSEDATSFRFTENDLNVHVEPQQTSGKIKISVVAERLNNKTELGVLELPLGEAIAACLDEDEESTNDGISRQKAGLASYMRWFPLMNPQLAVPVEGDLGLGARPSESEQLRDSIFQQYFTPCIQLALMWWPDNGDLEQNEDGDSDGAQLSQALSVPELRAKPSLAVRTAPKIQSYFNLDISRVSIALIDSQRAAEILSLTTMDIDFRYSVTKSKTRIGLVVGWIQLDHQDARSREPVVLAPTPTDAVQPTLQVLALRDNLRTKSNIVSYEYIGVALQEMDLTVEESWIFELWDFFMGVMRRQKAKKSSAEGRRTADFLLTTDNCFLASDLAESGTPSLLSVLEASEEGHSQASRRKIYIEQLILGLVKVNLSYIKGKKQSYEMAEKGAQVLKKMEVGGITNIGLSAPGTQGAAGVGRRDQSEVFLKWSQYTYDDDHVENGGFNLPGIIAAVFPSVSDAPIRLQGKVIDHVFESGGEIVSSIKNFYVNETLKQVYKIIGSLDFVGNPTIIFSSFVSGVRDLVAAPTSAFLKSPTNVNQVGIAVGKGTLSFFSHSASGIFGFAAKMSASAGQAAAILSLDAEYRQWHRDRVVTEATNLNRVWKRRGVQSVPEMVTRPLGDILMGVAMGASGLVVSPYKGLKRRGGWGLVTGTAVGIAGVVAKPIVGVLDAFTHFSATIHDVAKSVNVLERRYQPALKLRLPCVFGPMNILSPFDADIARSVNLLALYPPKLKRSQKYRKKEKEIFVHCEVLHMEPGVDTFAIVTTIRIVLVRLKKDAVGGLLPSFGWEVDLTVKENVTSRIADHGHNGVALTITRRVSDQKVVEDVKESKGWRSKRSMDQTKPLSSALSIDSGMSDSDNDDEDEQYAEGAPPGIVVTRPHDESSPDPGLDQGATEKGGEVLNWFTVLAEYQHRRQLTALHNALCCVLENFESIDEEMQQELDHTQEGTTKFGIFFFEPQLQDKGLEHASSAQLVSSLESLPWMHEEIFMRLKDYPVQVRKEVVASMRRKWEFKTDLDASEREGGPAWLVEARAQGMFVPNNPDGQNRTKSVVIVDETEEFEVVSVDDSSTQSEDIAPVADVKTRVSASSMSVESASIDLQDMTEDSTGRNQTASKDDLFYSVRLNPEKLEQHMLAENRSVDTEGVLSTDGAQSHPVSSVVVPQKSQPSPSGASASHGADRIDRMENLMEQLVVLNAQQAQRMFMPNDILSVEGHSLADSRVADALRQEITDLRSQVQARAAQDDVLRTEISLLRQQLAERREARNKTAKKSEETVKSGD